MRSISDEELKEIELGLLSEIHDICIKINIKYTLYYGSMLGAVRHHGFIPWDDDIDIAMLRSDYEAFIDYCVRHKDIVPFRIITNGTNENYRLFFAKAICQNTIISEDNSTLSPGELGVFVDIFPIDMISDNILCAELGMFVSAVVCRLLVAKQCVTFRYNDAYGIFSNVLRFFLFFAGKVMPSKLLNSYCDYLKKRSEVSKRYCVSAAGGYMFREIFQSSIFDNYILTKFEDQEFMCLSQYHKVLNQLYGDYMVLPSPDRQCTTHDFLAYYVE